MPTKPAKFFDDPPAPPGINAPEDYANVTPSDTVDLAFRCRAVWVGVAGNITFQARDGVTTAVMTAVPAGQWVLLRTNRIMATGTTATGILVGM